MPFIMIVIIPILKSIKSKGFKTAIGSFSNISVIAPALGIAAVNLSSGYYNAHQLCEYINSAELNVTLAKVVDIIADSARKDFPRFVYIEKIPNISSSNYSYLDFEEITLPKNLPADYHEVYTALLDVYSVEQLEDWRKSCGDKIILDVYIEECDPFYSDSYKVAMNKK